MTDQRVEIVKHVPERRRRLETFFQAGCCTCCCCLHSAGSLIGAAAAPLWSPSPKENGSTDFDRPKSEYPFSSTTMFWWLTAFLVFVCYVLGLLANGSNVETLKVTSVLVLVFFPILQVFSGFITFVVFTVWEKPGQALQIRRLENVYAGVFLGGLAGIMMMFACIVFPVMVKMFR